MLNYRRLHLALLLAAGLVISSATSRAVDPRLLPANTELVVTVNLKQILDSDLVKANNAAIGQVKAALDMLPMGGEVTKYLKLLGFDPFTHLTSVSVAHPGNEDPKELFVVIDGIFDAKKFVDTANTAIQDYPGIMKKIPFGTTSYYEIQVANESAYIALVDGKSLVVSVKEADVKGAITRSSGNTIVASKISELLKTTSDKQSMSFAITSDAVMRLAQKAKPGAFPAGAGGAGDITGITGALTVTKEINFMLSVGTKNENIAKDFEAKGSATLFLLRMVVNQKAQQEPDFAPVAEVMRTLRISSNGANTLLTGSVTQDNLEKLLKLAGKLKGGF